MGRGEVRGLIQTKGQKDTLGSERWAHYLHCGDDFTSITYVKTFLLYILNICSL